MIETKTKVIAAISYFSWLLFLVACTFADFKDSYTRQHLNQALILNIISSANLLLLRIPITRIAGRIIAYAVLVLLVWGVFNAVMGSEKPIPGIGDIKLL